MPVPLSHLNTPLPTRTQEPVMTVPAAPFTAETITTHTHRWIIPTGQQGAPLGVIEATVAAAAVVARRVWELPEGAALPGDALQFTVESGQIVVSFISREQQA